MTDATHELPQRWAAHGWRAARIASALFVFAPAPPGLARGRCVGDAIPTAGGWMAFTYPTVGRTLHTRHADLSVALDALCTWVSGQGGR
jgi:hypothetical protein